MLFKHLLIILPITMLLLASGCAEDKEGCTREGAVNYDKNAKKDNGSCINLIELDQRLVDITNAAYKNPHTGVFITNQDGGAVDTFNRVHGGMVNPIWADSTVRVIFTNIDLQNEDPKPGDIIIKKTYMKDFLTGNADPNQLLGITALHKQTRGYDPEHADWEFIILDKSKVSVQNPNGVLPPVRDDKTRGKVSFCYSCHKSGGSDYILYK